MLANKWDIWKKSVGTKAGSNKTQKLNLLKAVNCKMSKFLLLLVMQLAVTIEDIG